MNKSRKFVKALAVTVGAIMSFGSIGLAACVTENNNENKSLVIMTEALNGLFNPFFSTSGTDMDVVGMTQLSMLSTDENGAVAYGEDEATVVLDYKQEYDASVGAEGETSYYFVLKNGITFSDGVPLTMTDVLFNMYVYLDPAYTGSSTMYSTDIVGLSKYRLQQSIADGAGNADDTVSMQANARAQDRINELVNLYKAESNKLNPGSTSYDVSEADMRAAISAYESFSSGYKNAISNSELTTEELRTQLLEDYELTLTTFKEELQNDYESYKDAYTEDPYKSTGEFDEVTSFMYAEGFVTIKYKQEAGSVADKSQIESVTREYPNTVKDKNSAIEYVYGSKVSSALHEILTYWGTANTVRTDYISKATEVILRENLPGNSLIYDHIDGISSLGHEAATKGSSLTIGDKTYKIASSHNADGTVAAADEYDVLRVKINGIDPKAIWNLGFSVAPYHYYSDPENPDCAVDIENNKFGVIWNSFDFMKKIIQGNNKNGVSKNKVPLGAGAYAASDSGYTTETPTGAQFNSNNVVSFRAYDGFFLGAPKIKRVQYQVVSSTNALDTLKSGSVHFVTPQFTKANKDTIDSLKSTGIESKSTWQLGYGYIGINAGKVKDVNLRRAIMSAMNTRLALQYYSTGTVANISWPMSVVSWAYPRTAAGADPADVLKNMETNNNHDYTQFVSDDAAIKKIQDYMSKAGVSAGDPSLKIKFTIAGSNLTEHPTYAVFKHAAELLNSCGWTVEVVPDSNALIKLSTGSLTVWAAAWGSTIDPDMYQVYHKNSTATSVLSWGYREILTDTSTYKYEYDTITQLSTVIDAARQTNDQAVRTDLYKEAMGYVLDLAVEMPVYQRQELYAYNAKVIDTSTFPEVINSYSSPLGKLWEIDFVK